MKLGLCLTLTATVFFAINLMACTDTPTPTREATQTLSAEPDQVVTPTETTTVSGQPGSIPITGSPAGSAQPRPSATRLAVQNPTSTPARTIPLEPPPPTETALQHSAGDASDLPCDHADPANPMDISIPDGTVLIPGQPFSKVWRLVNNGSCIWTTDYSLVWFSGDRFEANSVLPLINPVIPGQSVDLAVDMLAPGDEGVFQSNWKLQNPSGSLFGLGPNGDAPLWVRIVVSSPTQETTPSPSPTETSTPTPAILVQGQAVLRPGEALNLDTNQIETGDGADLFFDLVDGPAYQIREGNGSLLGSLGADPPESQDCSSTRYDNQPLVFTASPQGYACVVTNQGLPGRVQILQISAEQALSIEITIWTMP